jgi:hypothetical protein
MSNADRSRSKSGLCTAWRDDISPHPRIPISPTPRCILSRGPPCFKPDRKYGNMDSHLKSPLLSTTRSSSATFPLTHGSPVPRPNDPISDEPFAGSREPDRGSRHVRRTTEVSTSDALNESTRRPSARPLEPLGLEGPKPYHRHKHSKSREIRLPRPMSHLASSASARGLLPTWSGGREKDREGDDGLLRPNTRETTRSRWGSESTSGSRKGSLLDTPEQHERLGPIRRREIQSMEDLELVKKRRKLGEE